MRPPSTSSTKLTSFDCLTGDAILQIFSHLFTGDSISSDLEDDHNDHLNAVSLSFCSKRLRIIYILICNQFKITPLFHTREEDRKLPTKTIDSSISKYGMVLNLRTAGNIHGSTLEKLRVLTHTRIRSLSLTGFPEHLHDKMHNGTEWNYNERNFVFNRVVFQGKCQIRELEITEEEIYETNNYLSNSKHSLQSLTVDNPSLSTINYITCFSNLETLSFCYMDIRLLPSLLKQLGVSSLKKLETLYCSICRGDEDIANGHGRIEVWVEIESSENRTDVLKDFCHNILTIENTEITSVEASLTKDMDKLKHNANHNFSTKTVRKISKAGQTYYLVVEYEFLLPLIPEIDHLYDEIQTEVHSYKVFIYSLLSSCMPHSYPKALNFRLGSSKGVIRDTKIYPTEMDFLDILPTTNFFNESPEYWYYYQTKLIQKHSVKDGNGDIGVDGRIDFSAMRVIKFNSLTLYKTLHDFKIDRVTECLEISGNERSNQAKLILQCRFARVFKTCDTIKIKHEASYLGNTCSMSRLQECMIALCAIYCPNIRVAELNGGFLWSLWMQPNQVEDKFDRTALFSTVLSSCISIRLEITTTNMTAENNNKQERALDLDESKLLEWFISFVPEMLRLIEKSCNKLESIIVDRSRDETVLRDGNFITSNSEKYVEDLSNSRAATESFQKRNSNIDATSLISFIEFLIEHSQEKKRLKRVRVDS